jgi:CDP-glycerol glycerophosphotransferase (TagB/SpsB family)
LILIKRLKKLKRLFKTKPKIKTKKKNEIQGDITSDAKILIYFPDTPSNQYQLEQWYWAFEQLNKHLKLLILFRKKSTYNLFKDRTINSIYVQAFSDLDLIYHRKNLMLCLYVNNNMRNFHSLQYPNLLHIFLNHGESDKASMASNQAKAYDFLFVAGEQAIERYKNNLINFNLRSLIKIGRPNLDEFNLTQIKKPKEIQKILYAPTWEGGRPEMNYTSLDSFGSNLIKLLLDSNEFQILYKPHPKVGINNLNVKHTHNTIIEYINQSNNHQTKYKHKIINANENILNYFNDSDILISDISSVVLDYLLTNKPIFICNCFNNLNELYNISPISKQCYILNNSDISTITKKLNNLSTHDDLFNTRQSTKEKYFYSNEKKTNVNTFIDEIQNLISYYLQEIKKTK